MVTIPTERLFAMIAALDDDDEALQPAMRTEIRDALEVLYNLQITEPEPPVDGRSRNVSMCSVMQASLALTLMEKHGVGQKTAVRAVFDSLLLAPQKELLEVHEKLFNIPDDWREQCQHQFPKEPRVTDLDHLIVHDMVERAAVDNPDEAAFDRVVASMKRLRKDSSRRIYWLNEAAFKRAEARLPQSAIARKRN